MTHTLPSLSFGLILLVAAPVAVAQPSERAGVDQASPRTPSSGGGRESLLARARLVHRRGEMASQNVQALLDEARATDDGRFGRCLDRRLSEINAHLRMIQDRYGMMGRAMERGAVDDGRRLLEIIERLGSRITEVELEAYSCPGSRSRWREGRVRVRVTTPR